ncbi:MAG: GTPase Era [Chlorobi bacterium]|nr:GTPase Era [Chlorobiota bacterium]MCI0716986.1 GTPase Era [Chlorobiota bacterium]
MQKKSGFVSIIGAPNAGKSTLINSILGQDISIVTPKKQTTRNKIFGIYTKDEVQIVFIDTPGILNPKYKLQRFMKREIESSFIDAELIILVIDSGKFELSLLKEIYQKYKKEFSEHKIFCVLNKIDLIEKENLLLIINEISFNLSFDEIIPVSAFKKFNIDDLIKTITKYLPENEFYFNEDVLTSQPERFFVSEIIRKNILQLYRNEIPFSVYVDIEEFKEREKGKDFIKAAIVVERDSQKAIIIGSRGSKIKSLGEASRKNIEYFLGRSVFLELFVKVSKEWKNDERFLKKNFNKLSSSVSG